MTKEISQQAADNATLVRPDEDGNYSSSTLAALVEVWDAYATGSADETAVAELLTAVGEEVNRQLEALETDFGAGAADPRDFDYAALKQAFESHRIALEQMSHYFETGEDQLVWDALALIQKATNQLGETYRGLMERDRVLQVKVCPYCAAESDRAASMCSACGARLPFVPRF